MVTQRFLSHDQPQCMAGVTKVAVGKEVLLGDFGIRNIKVKNDRGKRCLGKKLIAYGITDFTGNRIEINIIRDFLSQKLTDYGILRTLI